MAARRALVLAILMVVLPACGGTSDGGGASNGGASAAGSGTAAETAYDEAYRDAWVAACKDAAVDLRKKEPVRAAAVTCRRPVEQMQGNTSFDPEEAANEGREQGRFDGCAYAWDEVYAVAGDVEPRC